MTVFPDAESVRTYRDAGGSGLVQGGLKVCWAEDADEARRTPTGCGRTCWSRASWARTHRRQPTSSKVSALVTDDMVAEQVVHGPDFLPYVEAIRKYVNAGFDELYIGQMRPDQGGLIQFRQREVLPAFR